MDKFQHRQNTWQAWDYTNITKIHEIDLGYLHTPIIIGSGVHIGECTQLPAQYELDQCSAVEVLSSSSSRHKKHCADLSKFFSLQDPQRTLQICRSSLLRSTSNTADLPKFSLKIYIKHCRFVEVPSLFKIHNKHCRFVEVLLSSSSTTKTANLSKFLLSSRSTTDTVDLSEFFSLQAPPQTLQICRISSLFKIHYKHCILDDSSELVQERLVLSLTISQQLRMVAMRYLVHACIG